MRTILQRIADLYNSDVTVTSGDRDGVVRGSSRRSLHLAHRAADFHVAGMTDARVYRSLQENIGRIFDRTEGYEVIHHGRHTDTSGEHMHVGHYGAGRNAGSVLFKTEGLTPGTGGDYAVTPRAITGNGARPPAAGRTPPAANNVRVNLRGSVGRRGANLGGDVETVQALLNRARRRLLRADPSRALWRVLREDAICGPRTVAAIEAFQRQIVGFRRPDGRVDPRGRTLRMLLAVNNGDPVTLPTRIRQQQRTNGNANGNRRAQDLVNDPRVRAMLDTLVFAEGTGAGYGTVAYGTVISAPYNPELVGRRNVVITDFSRHPNILVQVNRTLRSTAAGRYQFLHGTWQELGLPDFTPANQDVGAVMLMRRRGMITPLLEGDFRQAVFNGAREWASLPTARGVSNYPGQHARPIEQLERVYNEALARRRR
ncbi:MAG TPA: glycoside hydrolase family 104 protein [Pyrinomonadaceae bacterium]